MGAGLPPTGGTTQAGSCTACLTAGRQVWHLQASSRPAAAGVVLPGRHRVHCTQADRQLALQLALQLAGVAGTHSSGRAISSAGLAPIGSTAAAAAGAASAGACGGCQCQGVDMARGHTAGQGPRMHSSLPKPGKGRMVGPAPLGRGQHWEQAPQQVPAGHPAARPPAPRPGPIRARSRPISTATQPPGPPPPPGPSMSCAFSDEVLLAVPGV